MIKKLRAFRAWVFAKPLQGAIVIFLLFVPAFSLLRLLLRTETVLAAPRTEILYNIVFGLFTSA